MMLQNLIIIMTFLIMTLRPIIADDKIPHWKQNDFIMQSFEEIALKNEYGAHSGRVRKWVAPIRYYYDHRIADQKLHEDLTEKHLRHLTFLSGISFIRTLNREQATLHIIFSTELQLADELKKDFTDSNTEYFVRHSTCMGQFFTTKDGIIHQAKVLIPVDRARAQGKLISCIVEELTQVMGLPNDSSTVFPSMFNDQSVAVLLTGLDCLLLKTLYDKRLKPGMLKKNVRPLLKTILREYRSAGIIQNAERLQKASQLYSLLY
jgi:DUF2927 family protein